MRNMYLALAALLISGSVAAAQTSTSPRLDGEGINMDRPPPLTPEPSHPADPLAPNTSNPAARRNDNRAGAQGRSPARRSRRYPPGPERAQVNAPK